MSTRNWPEVAYLKQDTPFTYGWTYAQATFRAGSRCVKASNLPPDEQGRPFYWVDTNPEPKNVVLSHWLEHYGSKVDADSVAFVRP